MPIGNQFLFDPRKEPEPTKKEKQRTFQISAYIPGLWTSPSVLYIGANIDRFHFANAFRYSSPQFASQMGKQIFDVIEIDRERAADLKRRNAWLDKIIVGDVREIDDLPIRDHYHAVVWSHGPTLLPEYDIEPTIDRLETIATLLVISCPWGRYKHRKSDEVSELDTNISQLRPMWFVERGFAVHCIGRPHQNGSNILAWKIITQRLYAQGVGL